MIQYGDFLPFPSLRHSEKAMWGYDLIIRRKCAIMDSIKYDAHAIVRI